MLHKGRAANRSQPPFALRLIIDRAILAHQLAVMAERDGDVKTRQRDATNHLVDMAKLGFLGAHKFATRGRVVEEIEHLQRGAARMRRRLNRDRHLAAFGIRLPGLALRFGARSQGQARN